jgi:hypothetical protein
MKKHFNLLWVSMLLVFSVHSGFAQKLDKYYTQRVQEGGDIYFIQPYDDFKNSDDHTDFIFDITYRQGTENATLNFTFYTQEPVKTNLLVISSGQKNVSSEVEKLYIDFVKKKWENRYSAQVPFADLTKLFDVSQPPVFGVETEDGQLEFSVSKSKWKKYAEAVTKIFYVISENN